PDGSFAGVVDVGISAPYVRPLSTRKPGEPLQQLWSGGRRLVISNFMDFDSKGDPIAQMSPFGGVPSGVAGFLKSADTDLLVGYHADTSRDLATTVTL